MSSIGSLIIFIVVFVLLFWVIRQMKGNEQFDERQLLGRYKACRSGFFAFMIVIVFIIVCLSQLVNAISQITSGTMIRDGRLTLSCLSILCVITFAAIIIMMLIHQRMTQEEA